MRRTAALTDPCGRFLPALMMHDVHDRLRGRSHRANARWGRLRRPDAPGRLIWIIGGASRESVRLGVELTRALVARRLDISALFTFEVEYPDLLAALARCPRTGWGYGPADYIGSMHAVWRRLLPFGIVVAGITPRHNLHALCEASRHALLVAPPAPVAGRFERIYPLPAAPCAEATSAPAADFDVLLQPPAAADAHAVGAAAARRLWCWHGDDAAQAKRLFALFRGHLPQDALIVGGAAGVALAAEPQGVLRLSEWTRAPLEPGTVVLADTPGWLAAFAPCLAAMHFAAADADALWQALGSGAVASVPGTASLSSPRLEAAVLRADDENDVIATWSRLAAEPALAAAAASAARAAHATETRLAAGNAAELIERVCRWQ